MIPCFNVGKSSLRAYGHCSKQTTGQLRMTDSIPPSSQSYPHSVFVVDIATTAVLCKGKLRTRELPPDQAHSWRQGWDLWIGMCLWKKCTHSCTCQNPSPVSELLIHVPHQGNCSILCTVMLCLILLCQLAQSMFKLTCLGSFPPLPSPCVLDM